MVRRKASKPSGSAAETGSTAAIQIRTRTLRSIIPSSSIYLEGTSLRVMQDQRRRGIFRDHLMGL